MKKITRIPTLLLAFILLLLTMVGCGSENHDILAEEDMPQLFQAGAAEVTLLYTDFVPDPRTAYATEFVAMSGGQQWFINEIERLLNLEQRSLNNVTSSADFDNIRALGFRDAGITGTIPSAIGDLRELRYLFLADNHLSGSIPTELFALPNLQEVDLADNNFSGIIPAQFGTMPSLRTLNLRNNDFTGTIPAEILGNNDIAVLNLAGNRLSGGVPADINNMTGLVALNLSQNNWGGQVPDVSGLTNLILLSMWDCGFTGEVHPSVYTLSQLQILDLAHNNLTGEIDHGIEDLTALEFLSLSGNRLRGTIPDVFSSTNLREIRLADNYLRGWIPASLRARYDAGASVHLQSNYLTGDTLRDIPGNGQNFVDGADGEQFRLTATQTTIQISTERDTNVFPLLRKRSTTTNTMQNMRLNPDEYEIIYDSTRLMVTITDAGILIRALGDIPRSDDLMIEIRILDNTGSDYSRVMLIVTTDTAPVFGGAPGGGGGGGAPVEHLPYIFGRPDGTFGPNDSVSREEITAMVIRASGTPPGSFSLSSFTDLYGTRWSFYYIEEAADRGFLTGFPDGTFRAGNPMTRAELAALLTRIAQQFEMMGLSTGLSFRDVNSSAWYYDEVMEAARLGLITGPGDGTFRPDQPVSRAEAVTMINRLLARYPHCDVVLAMDLPFSDVPSNHWAYGQIREASMRHYCDC